MIDNVEQINTERHGRIDARLGDKVDWDGDEQFTIYHIDPMTDCASEDGIEWYDLESCTLLHRPFQVGDEFDYQLER